MKEISPEAITCLATVLANELAKGQSFEDIALLKNVASQVVACLNTILSQKIINEKLNKDK